MPAVMANRNLVARVNTQLGQAGTLGVFEDFKYQIISGTQQTKTYAYNNMNQLLSISGAETASFTYGELGNIHGKLGNVVQQVRNGVTTNYIYDDILRLTNANVVGGDTNQYAYFGASPLRKTQTVTPNGGSATTTSFLYDGHTCVKQISGDFQLRVRNELLRLRFCGQKLKSHHLPQNECKHRYYRQFLHRLPFL